MSQNHPASTLLRREHDAINFVNKVRGYLNEPSILELPAPGEQGDGYDATTCPIALALGSCMSVSIHGGTITTDSKETADAIQALYGQGVNYAYDTYTLTAPPAVAQFVRLFDETWALESALIAAREALVKIANAAAYVGASPSYEF